MTISEALEQVELEPGRTYRCHVQGMNVELKVCLDAEFHSSSPRIDSTDAVELRNCDLTPDDDWLELPRPKPVATIRLKKGPPMTAMVIDQSFQWMLT